VVPPPNPKITGILLASGTELPERAPGASSPSPGASTHSIALGAFVLVVSLFFLWGVANNLNDILIKQFKKAFELSDFQAGLVQSAFYFGYFALAIPAGICTRKLGYKGSLLIGLGLYAAGALLFYPAALIHTYGLFLLALFIIASGLAFLETSANPLVTVLGPESGATRRLNLAQSFNPLGSITGVLIGQNFILSGVELPPEQLSAMTSAARHAYFVSESAAVAKPYLIIAAVVVVWAVLIAATRFPSAHAAGSRPSSESRAHPLLGNWNFLLAVTAQFFYVGAQVGVWSYLIRYAQATVPGTPEKAAANFLTISLLIFMAGRFAGTALMRYISPRRLLATFAIINILLSTTAVVLPGNVGIAALVVMSFFMSVMFPTIFSLGLGGLDDNDRKLGSSFLVMAIIGGAVLTAVMGAVSDAAGIARAMGVPTLCFAVVLVFAAYGSRAKIVTS
jgi:MFS transporter, FHS family, L-fucose permease